jgi:hypothetical protein
MNKPEIMARKFSLRLDSYLVEKLQMCVDRGRVLVSFVLRHLIFRLLEHTIEITDGLKKAVKELDEMWKLQAYFRKEIGAGEKEAFRLTNSALKAKSHPWANMDGCQKGAAACRSISSLLLIFGRFSQDSEPGLLPFGKRSGNMTTVSSLAGFLYSVALAIASVFAFSLSSSPFHKDLRAKKSRESARHLRKFTCGLLILA